MKSEAERVVREQIVADLMDGDDGGRTTWNARILADEAANAAVYALGEWAKGKRYSPAVSPWTDGWNAAIDELFEDPL